MGNLLSFPMNAWDLARDAENTANESLLAALAFLRDCLESDAQNFDDETLMRCKDATETALTAAMGAERKLHHQSLRLTEMERIACTDELTGAYNRRGFEQGFQAVVAARSEDRRVGAEGQPRRSAGPSRRG